MSVDVLERPVTQSGIEPTSGGVAARRAMLRWSWRLFKREWRQQLLILLLIIVAVAAVVVGSAVAVNTPSAPNAGFGTAHELATFNVTATVKSSANSQAHVAAQIAQIERAVGTVQVIANQNFTVPGSTQTYQLRSQNPHGPYGGPMLQLLSGHYPNGPNEIALTPGLASELNLHVGDTWSQGGKTVVGIVQNPQSLLDEFALVPPGQVSHPASVSVLFDASPNAMKSLGSLSSYITTPGGTNTNLVNPSTIILALATVGMLLVALVSIGGFTVLAQRRMRSLGMLESMGATDRNVRLVLEANGVIVGVVGAMVGFALGLALWLAYRPTNQQNAHHVIPTFALPWNVIAPTMVLAVVATFFAAGYPARAITRVPVVRALAGRPAPPRQIHRSLVPGVVALVIGFVFFSISGASSHGGGVIWLIPGLIALIVGIVLISPFFLVLLARIGARAPIAIRLPLRDMARYRARSGSALSAISLGIMIAVIVCAVAVARYSNVFDYVGPNMAANTVNVYTPPTGPTFGPNGEQQNAGPVASPSAQLATVHAISSAVGGTDVVELVNSAAQLQSPSADGRQWSGPIYVGTPALLRSYGINPSSIPANVDVLSSRSGLAGSGVQLIYSGGGKGNDNGLVNLGGPGGGGPGGPNGNTNSCSPGSCEAHPVVQEVSQLPAGTSAPNTVITESALRRLHIADQNSLGGWVIQANTAITSAQLRNANSLAAATNMSVESKNDAPAAAEIVNWATVFGIALALGVLAMSVGLIRSETASDLRTLAAAGASSRTRRALTAVTAGGLAFLGALLGTIAAYVGVFGFFRSNKLEGGVSDIVNHVPWNNLFFILIAMPVAAVLIGWVLAGREPKGLSTRPME
ncbi:MAG TPA: FtsX-like permease family protein [Acidimicrobiales bacterium]|nr:FtsX-like permease family protein [Acidimicrobiales bacterium]